MDYLDTEDEMEEQQEEEEIEAEEEEVDEKEGCLYIFLRYGLLILLSVLATLSLPIFGLMLEFVIGNLSIWSPITVPSQCKIVSSSVDLRSTKVCELGFLNYKAKHVFYSSGKRKFRCHYDYYWASVFKVEYLDRSGQRRLASAEAPSEALPSNCRPNFGAAWLAKDKFKVNGTYDCLYTVGLSKVYMHTDALFNCHAKDPSIFEMLNRYFSLSMKVLFRQWRWDVLAGAILGFSTSLLSYGMVRLLQLLKFLAVKISAGKMRSLYRAAVYLKKFCFFIAYFSFMSWLALQYIKGFGLSDAIKLDYSW